VLSGYLLSHRAHLFLRVSIFPSHSYHLGLTLLYFCFFFVFFHSVFDLRSRSPGIHHRIVTCLLHKTQLKSLRLPATLNIPKLVFHSRTDFRCNRGQRKPNARYGSRSVSVVPAFKLTGGLFGFKYYDSETGDPDPKPCPRSSKVCWFIHPNEPEWSEKGGGGGGGKRLSSPPRRYGRGRKRSSSPRRGRGRSRSRSRSRVRTRSRTRSRSNGRHKSPGRRRPRPSSPPPPRRPLYERIQRSHSPRPRLRSNSRPRSYSPHRRPRDRRPSMRTPTPISSSRGHTPPRYSKSDRPSLKVKLESSTDPVSSVLSNSSRPALGDTNTSVVGDQPPIPPRASVDRHHQEPTLSLTLGERATATSGSTQPPSPQTEPHSPVFGPETPVIPGLSSSVQFTQPQITAISALQKSLELVIRDQATMRPSTTPPVGSSTASHPATVPDGGRTEIWTTRVKCVSFRLFREKDRTFC